MRTAPACGLRQADTGKTLGPNLEPTDKHFNRMSPSIAVLEALSIHENPQLSRNNALPARLSTKKSYPKQSDFRCAGRATRSFTAVSLKRWFATSPIDALIDLVVGCWFCC